MTFGPYPGIWMRVASCNSGSEIITVAGPGAISKAMAPRVLSPGSTSPDASWFATNRFWSPLRPLASLAEK